MPRSTPSPIATAAQYDTLMEARSKLNEALNMIGIAEQCGHDCQRYRQAAQQMSQQLDRYFSVLFPTGQRPRG